MTDLHRFADIHNHVRRAPDTVTSVEPSDELTGLPGEAWYSVGIHPWSTSAPIADGTWARLAAMAADPRTVAVGETGLDTLRGARPKCRKRCSSGRRSLPRPWGSRL